MGAATRKSSAYNELNGPVPESRMRAMMLMADGAFSTGPMAWPLGNEGHPAFDTFL